MADGEKIIVAGGDLIVPGENGTNHPGGVKIALWFCLRYIGSYIDRLSLDSKLFLTPYIPIIGHGISGMTQLNISKKIALGFFLLMGVSSTLFLVGIFKMGDVEGQNAVLVREYLPEVDVTVELRDAVGRMRFEVQEFLFTDDKKQFDRARDKLSMVKASLMKARQLEAASPHLKKLKWQLHRANRSVEEYRHVMEKIIQSSTDLDGDRESLERALADYLVQGQSLLSAQSTVLQRILETQGQRIEIGLKLLNMGTRAAVEAPTKGMRASMATVPSLVGVLETDVLGTEDDKQIRKILSSAKKIRAAMGRYLGAQKKGATVAALGRHRRDVRRFASVYIDHCNDFLRGQHIKLFTTVSTGGERLELMNAILRLGRETRVDSFRAQLERNPDIMAAGLRKFLMVDEKLMALEQISNSPKDLAQIRGMKLAVGSYKGAMVSFLDNWAERQNLGEQLNHAGKSVVTACDITASSGMKSTDTMAQKALSSLSSASDAMVVGFIATIAISVLTAFFLIRNIKKTEAASSQRALTPTLRLPEPGLVPGLNAPLGAVHGYEIANLVKAMDDIADQARLLTIEAEKAGAAGAAFAMAADEVRVLSMGVTGTAEASSHYLSQDASAMGTQEGFFTLSNGEVTGEDEFQEVSPEVENLSQADGVKSVAEELSSLLGGRRDPKEEIDPGEVLSLDEEDHNLDAP